MKATMLMLIPIALGMGLIGADRVSLVAAFGAV